MAFVQEFKEFAVKGNAVDLAVGIVIGAAFGKIVTSLVNDIIMPPVGLLLGGIDFKDLMWVLREGLKEGDKVIRPAVTLNYGMFVNTILDFVIVALAIFVVIKMMNKVRDFSPLAKKP